MSDFLSSLKLQTFQIIAYLLPGIIMIYGFAGIVFEFPIENLLSNYFLLIPSFIAGLGLHSLFNLFKELLWLPYNKLKNKEQPKSLNHKLALLYRKIVLSEETNNNLKQKAKEKIESQYEFEGSGLELYYIKEHFFIQNDKISEYYGHLGYNKVFSSSSAVAFFLLAVSVLIKSIGWDAVISLQENRNFDIPYISLYISAVCIIFSLIFFKRAMFYKNYRSGVLNANTLLK